MKTLYLFIIALYNAGTLIVPHEDCSALIVDYGDFAETDNTKWSLQLPDDKDCSLYYFGAKHSKDPSNSQFRKIEEVWTSAEFDVVLYEGPDRGILPTKKETIEELGVSGFIRFLANKQGIPTQSLEPNPVSEIDYLTKHFSIGKIKLFFLLREAQRVRESFDLEEAEIVDHIQNILSRANNIPALKDTLLTIQDIEHSFTRYWGEEIKWWEAPSYWFSPLQKSEATGGIFTNDINRYSSHFRNLHMYRLITQLLKENKRVFAVVGRNHIPMQSDALRCEWEQLKTFKNGME